MFVVDIKGDYSIKEKFWFFVINKHGEVDDNFTLDPKISFSKSLVEGPVTFHATADPIGLKIQAGVAGIVLFEEYVFKYSTQKPIVKTVKLNTHGVDLEVTIKVTTK